MATVLTSLTAEEFLRLPDDGQPTELVRGQPLPMNVPTPRHGKICARIVRLLANFVDDRDLGHVFCNDSGILTEHDPDTVRGGDVSFFSYARLGKDADLETYPSVAPELVFEVRSSSDPWKAVLTKVAEYLNAGVLVVAVVDPSQRQVTVYYPDRKAETFGSGETIEFPDILPGWQLSTDALFRR
jgi:Uma2 family endonuclease